MVHIKGRANENGLYPRWAPLDGRPTKEVGPNDRWFTSKVGTTRWAVDIEDGPHMIDNNINGGPHMMDGQLQRWALSNE